MFRVDTARDWVAHIKGNIKQFCEDIFLLYERKASFDSEVYYGFIQFVSCLYVLPVLPGCLEDAGYDTERAISAISFTCFLGCSIGGFLTNLPFIIAPPAAVSIFLGVSMQQEGLRVKDANISVLISGALLLATGVFPPLLVLLAKVYRQPIYLYTRIIASYYTNSAPLLCVLQLIPDCILAATAVGIGLLTALAGAIHISLIVSDTDSLLAMGDVTPEVGRASCILNMRSTHNEVTHRSWFPSHALLSSLWHYTIALEEPSALDWVLALLCGGCTPKSSCQRSCRSRC